MGMNCNDKAPGPDGHKLVSANSEKSVAINTGCFAIEIENYVTVNTSCFAIDIETSMLKFVDGSWWDWRFLVSRNTIDLSLSGPIRL